MAAMLESYPELRAAFRGIWVRAQPGDAVVFALDLPMSRIAAGTS